MNNVPAKMSTECKKCEHSRSAHLEHRNQGENMEFARAGECKINGCECKHFVSKE